MDFIKLAQSRRSVRAFKQEEVPNDMILKLLEAAQAAPSGGNCQPWHFYVVTKKKTIYEIVEKSCRQNWITTAPFLLVVCEDIPRTEARYGERGKNLYGIQDTAAAIQNILLCASGMGLATCWCGAFDESACAEILDLQKTMRPVAIIPVGYPEKEPQMPRRRPIEDIATFIQ